MTIEHLFFELLQVAIGNRKELSHTPSAEEWKELFELSKKQALAAVAMAGVTKLKQSCIIKGSPSLRPCSGQAVSSGQDSPLMSHVSTDDGFGSCIGMDEMTYLKWLGLTAKVAQRNKALTSECADVCKELAHAGLQCVVIKGQSNLINYPEDLSGCRTAGDIDLWCLPHEEGIPIVVASGGSAEGVYPEGTRRMNYKGIAGVVEYAREWRSVHGLEPIPWHRVLYYHVEVDTDSGIEVELHYRPTYLNSPLRNWRLQRWFRENEPWGMCDANIDGSVFPILPISTNAVYQLLHIYKHLFEGGIGLRQLLDYYFVLRALHIEQVSFADRTQSMAQWAEGMGVAVKSNEEIMHTLGRFGMKKFAAAVMYVLQTVFEAPLNPPEGGKLENADWKKLWPWMICEPNEKEGKFLLDEIMQAGNFGKYDDRIKHGGTLFSHAIEKTKHNLRLLTHYPEEVIWEPFFRVYHWIWRRFELWRY